MSINLYKYPFVYFSSNSLPFCVLASFLTNCPLYRNIKLKNRRKKGKNTSSTPLSIDISPHEGESAGCKAGCADETQKVASTLALLCKGSSRRRRGTKRINNINFNKDAYKGCSERGSADRRRGKALGRNTDIHYKLLFVLLFFLSVGCSTKSEFYVSPEGNDTNRGTKHNPFLTVERAQKAVLDNPKVHNTIWLKNGIYRLQKPIVFEVASKGSRNSTLGIKATPGAKVVISGGRLLKGWEKNKNGIWVSELKTKSSPNELFIDGKRATRARFPNDDYLRVKKVGDDRRTHFFFEENDFPMPENTNDVELVLLHDWSISRIAVNEINTIENKLTTVDSIGAKNPSFFNLDHWEKNPRYFLENDLAFLDADYEWYFDAENGMVYLKLPKSQNPNRLQIEYPVAKSLLEISGMKNISFEGITFQNCAWQIPQKGYCGVQACHFDYRPDSTIKNVYVPNNNKGWMVVPAAIDVRQSEYISFDNCYFKNLGTSGLWLAQECKFCTIKNSVFDDIAGNGIMIGEGRDRLVNEQAWWKELPEQVALGNTIENCTVSNCGSRFFGAVGIWCGLTAATTIKNNHVYNLPYSGISIGWMWSPEPTPCRDNVVDGNHIHDILKILSDGGGIYMLGLQPGSRLINNHIHNVKINAGRAESNGMFLDEGTTDVEIAHNLIYNIARSPLRFHKATTNLIKNNFLFCSGDNPPIRYNRTYEGDIKKEGNKVYLADDENYTSALKRAITNWDE